MPRGVWTWQWPYEQGASQLGCIREAHVEGLGRGWYIYVHMCFLITAFEGNVFLNFPQ